MVAGSRWRPVALLDPVFSSPGGRGQQRVWVMVVAFLLINGNGGGSTPHRGEAGCGVYPVTLQQRQPLTRGEEVTISSRGFRCSQGVVGGTESAAYFESSSSSPAALGSAPVAPDGAFQITIRIPASASPDAGGFLGAGGPTRYICTGGAASCARYGVYVSISP